jgi:hypothetical protein
MMGWLTFIRLAFTTAICAWLFSAIFLTFAKHRPVDPSSRGLRVARWIFHELKPFIRAMAVIRFGIHCLNLEPTLWIHAFVLGMDLWNYHWYKDVDDDDDRWRRRKQIVLDKIAVVDGRLAVTPT